ncbi:unnamed protein product [Rhizophagus irregularis]|nr:unnamed protein product [Rhizophagus irregularis]
MGYGWTTSNLHNFDVTYKGAIEFLPFMIKATILTALLVSTSAATVIIHTDSQAATDGYNKSSRLQSISSRRFNKINNTSLWAAIHFIIKTLKLTITFDKIKAHSGITFNDIANALAKRGALNPYPPLSYTITYQCRRLSLPNGSTSTLKLSLPVLYIPKKQRGKSNLPPTLCQR